MKRLYLFAAVAGLTLVSASPPGQDRGRGPGAAEGAYPPCSRTVRDRCIQRERGVRGHHRRHQAQDGQGRHDAHARHDRYSRHDEHARHDRHSRHDEHARHDRHGRHDRAMAPRGGYASHARMASRCAARCAAPRRAVAARIRRAGERG